MKTETWPHQRVLKRLMVTRWKLATVPASLDHNWSRSSGSEKVSPTGWPSEYVEIVYNKYLNLHISNIIQISMRIIENLQNFQKSQQFYPKEKNDESRKQGAVEVQAINRAEAVSVLILGNQDLFNLQDGQKIKPKTAIPNNIFNWYRISDLQNHDSSGTSKHETWPTTWTKVSSKHPPIICPVLRDGIQRPSSSATAKALSAWQA